MIFLDANIFLRWLAIPTTVEDVARNKMAAALFDQMERGEVEAFTSEAILAEVAFILTSKRHYGVAVPVAAEYLAIAVQYPGLRFARGQKREYLRALGLWTARPALGFVDALTAAIVEHSDNVLATFDSDFDGLDGIEFWRPDNGHRDDPVPIETIQ